MMKTATVVHVLRLAIMSVLSSCAISQSLNSRPRCPSLFAWVRDPSDCARYWRCNWGIALKMPGCPSDTVLSDELHVCVYRGSSYNDCSRIPTVVPATTTTPSSSTAWPSGININVYVFCSRNNTGLMPHPSECQLYYNCSKHYGVVPPSYEAYLSECAYPLLYNEWSQTCQEPWRVDCRYRLKPVTACDYRNNDCGTPRPSTYRPTTRPHTATPFPVIEMCSRNSTGLMPHSSECQLYYNCSRPYGVVPGSYEHYLSECPFPLVYDEWSETCQQVWRVNCWNRTKPATSCDYRSNSCNKPTSASRSPPTTPTRRFPVIEYCARNRSELLPHSKECQVFYNCSHVYDIVPRYYEQFMQECPYPQLYDVYKQKCLDFSKVDCKNRIELITACDYREYRCQGAGCTPCDQVMPSCEGREDGPQSMGKSQEWNVTYVTCRAGRTVNISPCSLDEELQVLQVFSPVVRKCVNLYEVPALNGGLRPVCGGRSDGSYPEDNNRPDLFYVCKGGNFAGIYRCPSNRPYYDAQAKICTKTFGKN